MARSKAPGAGYTRRVTDKELVMAALLWIIAVILVIAGIVALITGSWIWGIVLIVVGLLVGPGGVSVFT
jgi:hypothetical protein